MKKKITVGLAILLAVVAIVAALCLIVFAFYDQIPIIDDGGALISPNGPRIILAIPELQKISESIPIVELGNVLTVTSVSLTVVTVVLTVSLTHIGQNVFDLCTRLTTVYYGGTAEEWAQITISDGNYILETVIRYDHSAEEPTTDGSYWHYDANGEIAIW